LTVAAVPTGIKTGVFTSPCGNFSIPVRALLSGSLVRILKSMIKFYETKILIMWIISEDLFSQPFAGKRKLYKIA
jgi:hypothetical protein